MVRICLGLLSLSLCMGPLCLRLLHACLCLLLRKVDHCAAHGACGAVLCAERYERDEEEGEERLEPDNGLCGWRVTLPTYREHCGNPVAAAPYPEDE